MMKIKLVAIAKDEAAYLPEWIYHHLNVGFDAITVLTNGICDNTCEVLDKISKHYPVEDVNVDYINTCIFHGFQRMAYGIELQRSREQGFTHVMFLDVDEYWVAKDFKGNIKDFLINLGDPDIASFPWVLLSGEEDFKLSFEKSNNTLPSKLVKTITKTNISIDSVRVHNIISSDSECIFVDGSVFAKPGEDKSFKTPDFEKLTEAFILHRITRGQVEYVSLLGRGNPDNAREMIKLKRNRDGYLNTESNHLNWTIDEESVSTYAEGYDDFLKKCDLKHELDIAKSFIIQRYNQVVEIIKNTESYPKSYFDKVLKNITIPEVLSAYGANRNVRKNIDYVLVDDSDFDFPSFKKLMDVDNDFLDSLRDTGIYYKKKDMQVAFKYLKLALALRPHGVVIRNELKEVQGYLSSGVVKLSGEDDESLSKEKEMLNSDLDSTQCSKNIEVEKIPSGYILLILLLIALFAVITIL